MLFVTEEKDASMFSAEKLPPMIEDLRKHTPSQLAELRLLLNAGYTGRPDGRRSGFYEIDGAANVYYVFRYPSGDKVLLLAAWPKEINSVAEIVGHNLPAA